MIRAWNNRLAGFFAFTQRKWKNRDWHDYSTARKLLTDDTDQNNMCEHGVIKRTQEAKSVMAANKRERGFIHHQRSEWTAAHLCALEKEKQHPNDCRQKYYCMWDGFWFFCNHEEEPIQIISYNTMSYLSNLFFLHCIQMDSSTNTSLYMGCTQEQHVKSLIEIWNKPLPPSSNIPDSFNRICRHCYQRWLCFSSPTVSQQERVSVHH